MTSDPVFGLQPSTSQDFHQPRGLLTRGASGYSSVFCHCVCHYPLPRMRSKRYCNRSVCLLVSLSIDSRVRKQAQESGFACSQQRQGIAL